MGAGVAQQVSLLPLLWNNCTREGRTESRGMQAGRPQTEICMKERSQARLPEAQVAVEAQGQRAETDSRDFVCVRGRRLRITLFLA